MFCHQVIEFVYGRVIHCAAALPGEDLFPQSLPHFSHRFHGASSLGRFPPLLPKAARLTGAKQIGCLKPSQERAKIRK
jgi:hypothetical protein